MVGQFPKVWFMVDHCGLPYDRDEATMKLWREGEWQTATPGLDTFMLVGTNGCLSTLNKYSRGFVHMQP